MRRLHVLLMALVTGATMVFVGAAPAQACPEPGNPNCTIWQSPICREEVPKAIRAAAGCFNIQP